MYGVSLKQYDIILFKVGKFDTYNSIYSGIFKPSKWIGIVLNNKCEKMSKSKKLVCNLIDPDDYFEPDQIGDIIKVGELKDLKYWLDFHYKILIEERERNVET
jgi:hypothetical protein